MSASFRGILVAAAAAGLLAVSGCTVQPLLAKAPAGSPNAGVAAQLASVAIAPVDKRYAQQVRNNLVFMFQGGAAEPSKPAYRLTLKVARVARNAATIQRDDEAQPTAQLMTLTATYVLQDVATGKQIAQGKREVSSPYDVPRQEYAVYRAEIDAENRAARELAEILRLTVSQALARRNERG